jgi:nicotinate-nucleotide adenylyltransferase
VPEQNASLPAPIALFGGTFDPVHLGHLQVACEVQSQLAIDDFRLLPAGDPPHRSTTFATAAHRLAMLELAVEAFPQLRIDRRELERSGPSWTVLTLQSLAHQYPGRPLLLVIGQDSANSFDQWHRWREILGMAHLVVMTRPGEEPMYSKGLQAELAARRAGSGRALYRQPAGLVWPLSVSPLDISSTAVRERIAAGLPLDGYLLPAVADYVRQHGLYAAPAAL